MNIEPKWILGMVAVCGLTAIQIVAFITGHNGQVLAITTGGIMTVIGFLLGVNVTSPAQKTAVREAITSIINNQPPSK